MSAVEPATAVRPRKPRERNPRRVVLDMLKEARKTADFMVHRWSYVPGTDFYRNAEGNLGYWGRRERADIPASEYIENDPRYWAELYGQMEALETQARKIKLFAYEQYHAKKGGGTNG